MRINSYVMEDDAVEAFREVNLSDGKCNVSLYVCAEEERKIDTGEKDILNMPVNCLKQPWKDGFLQLRNRMQRQEL